MQQAIVSTLYATTVSCGCPDATCLAQFTVSRTLHCCSSDASHAQDNPSSSRTHRIVASAIGPAVLSTPPSRTAQASCTSLARRFSHAAEERPESLAIVAKRRSIVFSLSNSLSSAALAIACRSLSARVPDRTLISSGGVRHRWQPLALARTFVHESNLCEDFGARRKQINVRRSWRYQRRFLMIGFFEGIRNAGIYSGTARSERYLSASNFTTASRFLSRAISNGL